MILVILVVLVMISVTLGADIYYNDIQVWYTKCGRPFS